MSEDTEIPICGYIKADGEPCQFRVYEGHCHQHTGGGHGRRSKFTEDRVEKILTAAQAGTTVEGCARAAGITHTTLYDWLQKHDSFSEAFELARSIAEQELVEEVTDQDPKFLLERSYGYNKTERREVEKETTVKGDGWTINYAEDSDE